MVDLTVEVLGFLTRMSSIAFCRSASLCGAAHSLVNMFDPVRAAGAQSRVAVCGVAVALPWVGPDPGVVSQPAAAMATSTIVMAT